MIGKKAQCAHRGMTHNSVARYIVVWIVFPKWHSFKMLLEMRICLWDMVDEKSRRIFWTIKRKTCIESLSRWKKSKKWSCLCLATEWAMSMNQFTVYNKHKYIIYDSSCSMWQYLSLCYFPFIYICRVQTFFDVKGMCFVAQTVLDL